LCGGPGAAGGVEPSQYIRWSCHRASAACFARPSVKDAGLEETGETGGGGAGVLGFWCLARGTEGGAGLGPPEELLEGSCGGIICSDE